MIYNPLEEYVNFKGLHLEKINELFNKLVEEYNKIYNENIGGANNGI
jgi:hypothetical protein